MYKLIAITLALAITGALAQTHQDYSRTRQQGSRYQQQQPQQLHQTFTTNTNNLHKLIRDDTAEARNPRLDVNHLQSFREYTLDLLRQSYFYNAFERTGAVSYCTFTIGHLLSVINERVFKVPVDGIPKVLHLKAEHVPVAYAGLLDTFVEDQKVTPSSVLYTPDSGLQVTPAYSKLRTVKQVLGLYQNLRASSVINDNIKHSTHDVINNLVVPDVPPFNESVVGVHSNTFYYSSRWVQPFTPVGEKSFYVTPQQEVRVNTLESTFNYPVTVAEGYSAVAIPLVADRKHVVLVQPKVSVQDFIQNYIAEIFLTSPQKWQRQVVRVQVPALNLTLGRNFVSQLNDLAGTTTQCFGTENARVSRNVVYEHYLHPIVQVISSQFSYEGYELAIANGVQVDRYNVEEARKVVKTGQQHHQVPHVVTPVVPVKTVREIDAVAVQTPIQPNTDFIFNKPYFVYVHDTELGAISFTAVKTPFVDHVHTQHNVQTVQGGVVGHQARHHVVNHLEFDEQTKVDRWNCGHDESVVGVVEHGRVGTQHQQQVVRQGGVAGCAPQY